MMYATQYVRFPFCFCVIIGKTKQIASRAFFFVRISFITNGVSFYLSTCSYKKSRLKCFWLWRRHQMILSHKYSRKRNKGWDEGGEEKTLLLEIVFLCVSFYSTLFITYKALLFRLSWFGSRSSVGAAETGFFVFAFNREKSDLQSRERQRPRPRRSHKTLRAKKEFFSSFCCLLANFECCRIKLK